MATASAIAVLGWREDNPAIRAGGEYFLCITSSIGCDIYFTSYEFVHLGMPVRVGVLAKPNSDRS